MVPPTFSRIFKTFLIAFLVYSLTGCEKSGGVNPGEKIPDFSLKTLDGKTVDRDSLKGRATVLSFWASWCEPCIRELPSLERLNSILEGKGARVVSIGIDDSAVNLRKSAEQAGVTFPVLVDDKGLAKRRFQVKGVPETFLVTKNNEIQALMSDSGAIEVRLRGPREWDSKETVALLSQALGLD
jgi:peroxiredoxin